MTTAAEQTIAKRTYRDSETVKAERLAREQRLIEKRQQQVERAAARAKELAARLTNTKKRAKEIEAYEPKTSGRTPKEPMPTLKEAQVTRFAKELTAVAKELGAKHGLTIDEVAPKIVHRGSGMSVSVRGGLEGVKHAFRKAGLAGREAMRFMSNHGLIGLNKNILNREVKLNGMDGTYMVIGLKGRANQVVVQKIGSDDFSFLDAADFKAMLIES
jgi:hypothetical protein